MLRQTTSAFLACSFRKPHCLLNAPFVISRTTSTNVFAPATTTYRPTSSQLFFIASTLAIVTLSSLYSEDDVSFAIHATTRCFRVAFVGAKVAVDYKLRLKKTETSKAERADLHRDNARKVLEVMRRNGGVYIKLGQQLAAMNYVLPNEWCDTMKELQDKCPPTTLDKVNDMFLQDLGKSLDDVFVEFNPIPLGVASLAQVHRARLRSGGDEVAVKIQHHYLDEYARIDINTTALVIKITKWIFPEFEFAWLADEMKQNLPNELDFVHEAANAEKTRSNFEAVSHFGSRNTLHIPRLHWAKKRIMCMEFIEGGRVDNLAYLKKHSIDPKIVRTELAKIFSEMIFIHGWVHCDPHPGNIMIRHKEGLLSPLNFEIVILDHGLYRELPDKFRKSYMELWRAIISSDEEMIKSSALELGGTDAHRLLSCMLTGRTWNVVANGLKTKRTNEELVHIREQVGSYLVEVADLLAKVPRELLLLFKTNDLLRSIDQALHNHHSSTHTFLIMGRYCSAAMYEDQCASSRRHYGTGLIGKLSQAWLTLNYILADAKIVAVGLVADWIWWVRRMIIWPKQRLGLTAAGVESL